MLIFVIIFAQARSPQKEHYMNKREITRHLFLY